MKKYETDMKTSLLDVDAQYTSGQIRYTEYIKQRLEALQTGYDNQLELLKKYGKTETSEYDNLLAKKKKLTRNILRIRPRLMNRICRGQRFLLKQRLRQCITTPIMPYIWTRTL